MHRSSDLTDEPSRFKQFAWEQWENQPFAVLFRYVEIEVEENSSMQKVRENIKHYLSTSVHSIWTEHDRIWTTSALFPF